MKKILFPVIALAAAGAVLLGGTLRERTAAPALPGESERVALRGLDLQQEARISGNPLLYPQAEKALLEALRLDPKNATAVRGLAALAAGRHRFGESLVHARRAQKLEPQVAAVYGLIGDANLELGRYRQAFAAFDRMVALKPSASGYARISYARELTGDLAGAIDAMELAVDSAGVGEPAAWTRSLVGNLLLAERRPAAAELRFREALAFFPDYPAAVAGLGEVALARSNPEAALRHFRRAATAAVPEYPAAVGDVLARLGRTEEAERAWKRAEELEMLFAANGGRNLLETAEFDLNHDRNVRDALARARRGRAERPSVEGDHVLAWALYKNGLCAEARTVSLRSLRLGTLDVDGLYHHSLIESCLGNTQAARTYRLRVQQLDPLYLQAPPSAKQHRA